MPARPGKTVPRSERLTFHARLCIYSALLCVPTLGLLAALLVIEHLSATTIASILTVTALVLLIVVAAFLEQTVRPLQTLANVVNALREEDYSFRARGARREDPFGELAIEINALADMHQSQRMGALEAAALFRRVIAELDAPVLAFDQARSLRLANPAAERLFSLAAERDLGRTAAELNLESLLDQPDEGVLQLDGGRRPPPGRQSTGRQPTNQDLSQLANRQQSGYQQSSHQQSGYQQSSRWIVRRSSFRQRGVPHTLLLLSDVSSALREEERLAWRRLIRVLGHEISNSLAPIKSIAGSLRSRLPQAGGASPSDLDRGLGVIESRAESLNRFVQAYRELAQLPAPVMRRIAVQPLLERVVSLEQRLEVSLTGTPSAELLADPDQMEQLLINLVRNGVEAAMAACEDAAASGMPAVAPAVSICGVQQDGSVSIFVADNGAGLTNPVNLFVPFYTTKKAGSGVGLALARQIAEAHGGTLDLRNRSEGNGCEAELRLPIAPAHASEEW